MTKGTGRGGLAVMLRLACVALLLAVGLLHQMPAAAARSAGLETLPDGTIASLCSRHDAGGEDKGHIDWHGCEVCRLSAAIVLPVPPVLPGPIVEASLDLGIPSIRKAGPGPLKVPQARPRAPPAAFAA